MTTTSPPVGLARQLRSLLRPWRGPLIVVAIGVLTAAALDLVPPLAIGHVVDAITASNPRALPGAAIAYLAATVAVQALTAGYGYLAASVAQRALATLRTRLFAHLLALPTRYHDRTPVGDAVARATADVETIDGLFSANALTLLAEAVRLITVVAAMLVLSPTLTLVALAVVPGLALLTNFLRRRIRDAERATRTAVGAVTTDVAEYAGGVMILRAFGREAHATSRFRASLTRWLAASNRSTLYNSFYAPGLAILAAVATAGLLRVGGASTVGIGTLTAFVLLFARFFNPLINLGDEWQSVQAALAGAERVFMVLAIPAGRPTLPAQPTPGDRVMTVQSGPSIVLDRVDFGYDADRPVLRGIDFSVRPGEHVALVGRSGAGKTSVVALLSGLYRPDRGRVRLGGRDPTTISDEQRRAIVGVVPQAVHLFTSTVYDNLTMGDSRIPIDQVVRAAKIAGAHAFISSLPEGYQTQLSGGGRGEGVVVSAGQRQLIALARALVANPAILLLDEATAVVDPASDAQLRESLARQRRLHATAILTVAHRLSTARDADRVIVMHAGRIVEDGAPAQLAAADSYFAALCAIEEAGWD